MNNKKKVGAPSLRKKTIRFYDFIYMPWSYCYISVYGYVSSTMSIEGWRKQIENGYFQDLLQKPVKSIDFSTSNSNTLEIELED